MSENPIVDILKQIPFFQDLNEEDHTQIINNITLEYYPANHLVFKQGDPGDGLYIIKSGKVKIFQGPAESPLEQHVLAELEANAFFGEMSLVSDKPRNASALTLENCEIFVLKKEDFMKLVQSTAGFAEKISNEFIDRTKKNVRDEDFEQ